MEKRFKSNVPLNLHPILGMIAGVILILVGLFLSDMPTMIASQGWPSTAGVIISNKLVGTSYKEYDGDYHTEIQVYIRYQYSVNGMLYSSSVINSVENPFSLYPPAFADLYPIDKEVTVYYNPKNPAQAVLEPGWVFSLRAFDVFSVLFTSSGFIIILQGFSRCLKDILRQRSDLNVIF